MFFKYCWCFYCVFCFFLFRKTKKLKKKRILTELGKIKTVDKNTPILFGGDLNFTPQNVLYTVLFERAQINKIDFFEV